MSKLTLHKLVRDMTSEAYHGLTGTYSSSQIKTMLASEEEFIAKYIKKTIPREEKEAFDTGNYFHTGVLEPHKVKKEIAFFDGEIRRGKAWEKFKKKNKNKITISKKQKEQGDKLISLVTKSKTAKKYLIGEPEVSLFIELIIFEGEIYAPHFKMKLTKDRGWVKDRCKIPKGKGFKLIIKVRADNLGKNFVSDLKSTHKSARLKSSIRSAISDYGYDLSAALYLDMFSLIRPVKKFVWIFASKSNYNVGTWIASSENIKVGRAKYIKALLDMARCAKNDWKIEDIEMIVEPLPHEREWLVERDIDLL